MSPSMRAQTQIDRLLALRAAEWVETLKAGDRAEHAAFLEWLRESRLHVEHYLETEALDRQIRALDPRQGPDIGELLARIAPNVTSIHRDPAGAGRAPRSWLRSWQAAAAIALLLAGALVGGLRYLASSANEVMTATGEQRNVTLPDGSRLFVNASSRLHIEYSARQRRIALDSGEAVFQVARDADRPFIVSTPTATVRALGTQFNVYQKPDETVLVSVIEGRVQVTPSTLKGGNPAATGTAQSQNLGAGEEAQVTPRGVIRRAHPDVGKTLGWREGRLYFDETPLEEMVREFNRYGGPMRLELEGKGFARYRFGGVFNASDPEMLVQILERQKGLHIERRPGGVVVIRASAEK